MDKRKLKVLVGMSGGVDSSVAAALLVEQGFDVTGGFIKNWSDSKDLWTGECAWRGERRDALRVAARLGIPLLTFDFEKQYRERVLERMFREYESGLTPNPDVLCNEEIKFGLFYEEARKLGFDAVATGHYAQVRDGRLYKAKDNAKDQSYFLHRVLRGALSHILFPIGHLEKTEVRRLAKYFSLPVADKSDSQGICFVGKLDFHEFLRKRIPSTPGEIVTPEGEVVGHHDGLDAFTIGQRQGLFVSKDGKAWYVADKNREKNRLVIVSERDHPMMYKKEVHLDHAQWNSKPPKGSVDVAVRYHAPTVKATFDDERLVFSKPVWAPAAGQSAVLYKGDECLGGGFIRE